MPEPTTEKNPESEGDALLHSFKEGQKGAFFSMKLVVILIAMVILGLGTGYGIAQTGGKTGIGAIDKVANTANVEKGKTYGSDDTETFSDIAEGELKEGGIEGEGQFHLVRPGGASQNVYLTSSLVDLSQFEGRKIKVWGQTQKAQVAGWLMDVGRVQVLE